MAPQNPVRGQLVSNNTVATNAGDHRRLLAWFDRDMELVIVAHLRSREDMITSRSILTLSSVRVYGATFRVLGFGMAEHRCIKTEKNEATT